jgi:hypothetical protein
VDGINRFSDLSKIVKQPADLEIAAEEIVAPESASQITAHPAVDLGATDNIESFNTPAAEIFTEAPIEQQLIEQAVVPPQTNQDAAGAIDFTKLISTRVDTSKQKWDAIYFLMDEMTKTPPDQKAMFDALQALTPQDRKAVLEQFASQGKAPNSDLDKLVNAMYGKTGSADYKDMGDFLATLARDVHNDPSEGSLFGQIYGDCYNNDFGGPGFVGDQTMITFMKDLWGDSNPGMSDILKSLPQDTLLKMQNDILTMYKPDNFFYYQPIREAIDLQNGMTPGQAAQEVGQDVTNRLNAIPLNDPNYGGFLSTFGQWGMNKLVELSSDPTKLSQVIQGIEKGPHPEQLREILTDLCTTISSNFDDPFVQGTPADLSEVLRQILSTLQTDQQAGGKNADNLIRDLVNSLKPDAIETLSKLTPTALIEMSLILKNGDDQALNVSAKSIVDQALQNAES